MDKKRRCWSCHGEGLLPHEPVHQGRGNLWFFKCQDCGARIQWVKDPDPSASPNSLHFKSGGFSCASMLNDPDCTVFQKEQKPIFVEDDRGNRTHRWHYGRGEWVKLPKRSAT